MFRPLTPPPSRPRRGAILVVVLALLALFAVIGIAFVFYADAEAQSAKLFREAQTGGGPGGGALADDEYKKATNQFLGDFLFGSEDLLNVLRGHDLMATLYGGMPAAVITGHPQFGDPNNVSPSVAFDGVGLTHEPLTAQFGGTAVSVGNRSQVVNHTAMLIGTDTFLIDPHWTGKRAVTGGTVLGAAPSRTTPFGRQYAPKNVGVTYQDLNNYYLAALAPTSGQVLVPSFFRYWHFNTNNVNATVNPNTPNFGYKLAAWNPADTNPSTNTAQNTDWVTPEGRLRILRPRPIDQLTPDDFATASLPFPIGSNLGNYSAAQRVALYNLIDSKIKAGAIIGYPPANAVPPGAPAGTPGTVTGDVQNLAGGVGVQQNDSLFLHTGTRPLAWNGKFVVPLVAALVLDQDGLLNLNVHGNIRGGVSPAARSWGGYGPWEVNPAAVLGAAESEAVVRGRLGTSGTVARRDPNGSAPTLQQLFFDRSGSRIPGYSLVNWDAGGSNPQFQVPNFGGPGNNPFATSPFYNGTQYYDDNDPTDPNNKARRHPGLFTPNDWGRAADPSASSASPFTLPLSDLRRLRLRFAAPREEYEAADFGRRPQAPVNERPQTTLVANRPAGPGYRLDPAHPNRMLFTPLSASLDAPAMMPNYDQIDGAQGLQLPFGAVHAVHTPANYPLAFPNVPSPVPPTVPSDLGPPPAGNAKFEFRNVRAALGPIDLNRPLADYRTDSNQLSTANVSLAGNVPQAWADRQNLARDIFARLVVAAGANAIVDPLTGNVTTNAAIAASPGNPDYNALRYLAQLAANIVDYIDNDDISTPFIWNPTDGTPTGNAPLAPVAAADILTVATANMAAAQLQNRVVFGVEKPRLVLNEVYSEITNAPGEQTVDPDPTAMSPKQAAHVRFWVEFLNPTSNAGAGPIGDGSVKLKDGTVQAYRLQITRNGSGAATELAKPENVTGGLGAPIVPEIEYKFTRIVLGDPSVQPNNGQYDTQSVSTQGIVVYGPQVGMTGKGTGPQSFEFNPKNTPPGPWTANMQEAPVAGIGTRQDALNYQIEATNFPQRTALQDATYKRHLVALQRLANPYLPANDPTDASFNPALPPNPYLTVDYMDHVPTFDAVNRAATEGASPPSPKKYVDEQQRFAVGKVQPYAGLAGQNNPQANGTVLPATFPNAFVLAQGSVGTGTTVQQSFGRHNGLTATGPANAGAALPANTAETLMAPFDWLVHFDRPLVNQLELLHVQAVKPHLVTQFTLQPPAPASTVVRRGVGLAPWLGVQPSGTPAADPTIGLPVADTATFRTNNGLYRALDAVRVRPWTHATGLGGRVHGRVNLNTVQDSRILLALLDPSDLGGLGNKFTSTEVTTLWNGLFNPPTIPPTPVPVRTLNSRTLSNATDPTYPTTYPQNVVVPVPGATTDDDPVNGTDRPFRAFGAADLAALAGNTVAPAGLGLRDTLLRAGPNGRPLAFVDPATQPDPYLQSEMVRKLLNNTTTTSNVFAVHLTVVWHEVRVGPNGTWEEVAINEGTGPNGQPILRPRIAREAYKDTPLDMRQQYFAVVDRSNCWLAPDITPAAAVLGRPASPPTVLAAPFSSALGNTANPSPTPPPPGGATTTPITVPYDPAQTDLTRMTVWADGQPVVIRPGSALVLGTGAAREVVVVADNTPTGGGAPFVDIGGTIFANVFSPLTRQGVARRHEIGELVSNGIPGHPGPQVVTVVNNGNSPHKPVVPFAERVSR